MPTADSELDPPAARASGTTAAAPAASAAALGITPTAPPTTAVIFDLDGTLVQTRVASWEIFREINDEFGLGLRDPEEFYALFRGNIFAALRDLARDDQHAEQVKAAFLQRLRDGYAPPMVPGMPDVVRRLAERCTLAVMSSNAMSVLRRVLSDNGIALCFAQVFGGDVVADKREAIRQFLADTGGGYGRRCQVSYDETSDPPPLDRTTTVLVTDTAGDVRDAMAEGIRVVAVAWGMHSVEELTEAGAEFVAIWPQELASYLLAGAAPAGPSASACRIDPAGGCDCGCSSSRETASALEPAVAAAVPVPIAAARDAATVRRSRRRAAALRAPAQPRSTGRLGAALTELRAALARTCRPR